MFQLKSSFGMFPLNISYLIWASWKPRLQPYVLCRNALWRNRSNSNFSFPGNIIMTKQLQHTTKWSTVDSLLKIEIIADYFYSILRCNNKCDFLWVSIRFVDSIFLGKKKCNAIAIPGIYFYW